MILNDPAALRLRNQRVTGLPFESAEDAVRSLAAVQSQDFGGAKWALALRTGQNEADLDAAFAEGRILRTHVLRPTWHFVHPEDIRWLLILTAPRVKAASTFGYRQAGLNDEVFERSRKVLAGSLEGGKQLTRDELAVELRAAGIATEEIRLIHLMMRAELDGLVCSGPRRGKQFTYALLEERVPPVKKWTREESLAELAFRYFRSRGPATLKDFVWWSGLTSADAKTGIELNASRLESSTREDQTHWFSGDPPPPRKNARKVLLLPNYDEYIVGYTDRSAAYDGEHQDKLDARGNPLFQNTLMIEGRLAGTWKRTIKKKSLLVEVALFRELEGKEAGELEQSVTDFGEYSGLPAVLELTGPEGGS